MKNLLSVLLIGVFAIFGRVVQKSLGHDFKITVSASLQSHTKDSIFVAGAFNDWNPRSTPLVYDSASKNYQVVIKDLINSDQEFKFTRGSWSSVQCDSLGQDIDNNKISLNSDSVVHFVVQAWRDDFETKSSFHSANKNVQIFAEHFAMPQLNDKRKIWVYLPTDYKKGKSRYPVIYMQDGQNLFDNATSNSGEWGVDEMMDSLIAEGQPAAIIVGIENGPNRINEYNPFDNEKFGKGLGDAYLEFLVKTLKPAIDKKYRTVSAPQYTIIAGSSMGALISYYAVLKYPGVFGKAGVFSPSFWIAPEINDVTSSLSNGLSSKLFFSIGKKEGDRSVDDMVNVMDNFASLSKGITYSFIDETASHNEMAWHNAFPQFYRWIMASGANVILPVNPQ